MAGLDLGTVYATMRLRNDQLTGDVSQATSLVQGFGQELERVGNIAFGVALGQQVDDLLRKLEALPRSLVQASASFESFTAGVAAMFDVAARQPAATAQQAAAFADAQLTQQTQRLQQAQAHSQDIIANQAAAVQRLDREQGEAQQHYARSLRDAAQQQSDFREDQSRADERGAQDRVLHAADAQRTLQRQLADYNAQWAQGAQERASTFTQALETMETQHSATLGKLQEDLGTATSHYQRQLSEIEAAQQAALQRFQDEAAQTVADTQNRIGDIQVRLHDRVQNLQLTAQRQQVEYTFQVEAIQQRLATATQPGERLTAQRDLLRARVLEQLRQQELRLREAEAQQTAAREEAQAQREEARRLAALRRQEAQERESAGRRRADLAASYTQREAQLTQAIDKENAHYAQQSLYVRQQYAEHAEIARANYTREVANAEAAYQQRVAIDERAWTRQEADRQFHLQREQRDYAQLLTDLADTFHERQVRLEEEATNVARTFAQEQRKALAQVAEAQQKLGTDRQKLEEGVLEQGRATATMFTDTWIQATNAVAEAHGRRGTFRPPEGIDETTRDMDKARQVFEALLQVERQVPVPLRDLQTAFQQLLGAGIDPFKNDLIVTVAELSRLPQVRGGITEVARAFQELAAGAPGQAERVFRAIGLPLERVPGLVRTAQGHVEGFIDANGRLNTSTAALFDRVAAHIGQLGESIRERQAHTFATLTSTLETMAYQFQLIAGKELFGRLEDDIRAFIGWMDEHKSEVAAAGTTLGNALAGGLEAAVAFLRQLGDPILLANLGQLAGTAGELGGSLLGLASALKAVAFAGGDQQASKALGLFNDVMGDLGHGQIDAAQTKLNDFGIDLHQIADLKWDAQGNLLTPIEEASGPIHDAIYNRIYSPTQQVADRLKDIGQLIQDFRKAVEENTPGIIKDFGDILTFVKQIEDTLNRILGLEHDLHRLLHPGESTDIARQAGSYEQPATPTVQTPPGEVGTLGPTTVGPGAPSRGVLPTLRNQVQGLLPQYATGGPINRRTWLVDERTGRVYAEAGEAGPEDIVPRGGLAQTAGGGATFGGFGSLSHPIPPAADRRGGGGGAAGGGGGQPYTPESQGAATWGQPESDSAFFARHGMGPEAQAAQREEAHHAAVAASMNRMLDVAEASYGRAQAANQQAEDAAAQQLKSLATPGRARYAQAPGTTAYDPLRYAGGSGEQYMQQRLYNIQSGYDDSLRAVQQFLSGGGVQGRPRGGSLAPFDNRIAGAQTAAGAAGGAALLPGMGGTSTAGGALRPAGLGVPLPAASLNAFFDDLTQGRAFTDETLTTPADLGPRLEDVRGALGDFSAAISAGVPPPPGSANPFGSGPLLPGMGGTSTAGLQTGGGANLNAYADLPYDFSASQAGVQALLAGEDAYKGSGAAAFAQAGGGRAGRAGAATPQVNQALTAQQTLTALARQPGGAPVYEPTDQSTLGRRAIGPTGAYDAGQAAAQNQNPAAYVPPPAYNPQGAQSVGRGISVGGNLVIQQTDTGLMREVVGVIRTEVEANR